MDAYLAIVSKREVRRYRAEPLPEDVLTRILEAGRATGSSRNRQPWRFILVTERARLNALSTCVSRPSNLLASAAAIVIALTSPEAAFDGGRAAQNMMLAAWALGVGSCPNTPTDATDVRRLLALPDDVTVATILSMGRPAPGERRPPRAARPEAVLARIDRRPLAEVAFRETYGDGAARA
ncbi:MAG: nitroreductase family protein [Armatimonadota bacterium]|nr:nitroreductase family protein [Armatimonadota bacterium]MDR7452965.1 nitroreductase family protein [Armatimonadota bacterium]MDR7456365.1 nitroreductase family protein [Armatimonadota bacterium]MDR7496714.1 nitroreductase family protein [Armatimonadota bacterium]MDR7511193.1 nitroreductase family protein [Armatimonadota bacterium]